MGGWVRGHCHAQCGAHLFWGRVNGFQKAHKGVCDLKKLRNRIELLRTLHAHLCDSFVPTSERTLEKESREKKKAIEGLWAVESLAPASSRSAHTGVGVGIIPGPSPAVLDLAERGPWLGARLAHPADVSHAVPKAASQEPVRVSEAPASAVHGLPGEENRAGINKTLLSRYRLSLRRRCLGQGANLCLSPEPGLDIVVNGGFHPPARSALHGACLWCQAWHLRREPPAVGGAGG